MLLIVRKGISVCQRAKYVDKFTFVTRRRKGIVSDFWATNDLVLIRPYNDVVRDGCVGLRANERWSSRIIPDYWIAEPHFRVYGRCLSEISKLCIHYPFFQFRFDRLILY